MRLRTNVSSTALPAPPCTTFSSTVTSISWLAASSATSASSSGLTKRMFATVAFSASPASSAGLHHAAERQNRDALSAAADLAATDRKRLHFPIDAVCRGRCRADSAQRAGVSSMKAVYNICQHSFSSLGAITVMIRDAAQIVKIESALMRRTVRADQAAAIDGKHHRQILDARRHGSADRRRAAGTSNRSPPPASSLRRPCRRRTSLRAARRYRRRNSAPEIRCEKRTRPEPSRMAGVIPIRRSSCAAMSHSQSPNTCV